MADSLRATLLCLVHNSLGDDYLELLDGTAPPPRQHLDRSVWLTERDRQEGREAALDALIVEFQSQLKALGVRGVLYVASDGALLDERSRIRRRLYGEPKEG